VGRIDILKKIILKILPFLLVISVFINYLYFRKINVQDQSLKNYYNTSISYVFNDIQKANKILNDPDFDSWLMDERLYSAGEELGKAGHHISILNVGFTLNSRNKGYSGELRTSEFFFAYENLLKTWAQALRKNEVENKPTEKELYQINLDLQKMENLFTIREEGGLLLKNKDPLDYDYESLEAIFRNFMMTSLVDKIRLYSYTYVFN
jgi:hypothetical protein